MLVAMRTIRIARTRAFLALLGLTGLVTIPSPLVAQADYGRGAAELAAYVGLFVPLKPSLNADEPDFSLKPGILFGGRAGYVLPVNFFVEADLGYSPAELERDGERISLNALLLGLTAGYNLQPSPSFQLPLMLGVGAISWAPEGLDTETDLAITLGIGMRAFLSPTLAIRGDLRDRFAPNGLSATRRQLTPGLEHGDTQDANHNIEFSVGASLYLGGSAGDADRDGVPDDSDLCANTVAGARVDSGGCPLDSDGDRVPDVSDACPDTPAGARVDGRGCPLDNDADGVPDGLDLCPATPAGAAVDADGCPSDEDLDGVPDGLDSCPGTPDGALVDAQGCPVDSDADGVPDGLDSCPDTPAGAGVGPDGCTRSAEELALLGGGRISLEAVEFAPGTTRLRDGIAGLDAVGSALLDNPALRVEIQVHTDAVGTAANNMALSQRQADAVLAYLLQSFPELDRSRFVARGYGEQQPVASNQSAAGRARNRRVDFVVLP